MKRLSYTLIALCFITLIFITGCTNSKDTKRILKENGFSNIKITGFNLFACSNQDDWYHTGFIAKSTNGSLVSGTVCQGLFFKNSTIRFK